MLTQDELDLMAGTAEESMIDTCVLMTATTTYDVVGGAVQTWTDGAPTECGVEFTSERRQESIEVAGVRYDVDATVRLPLAVTPTSLQRIRVTHRYGVALTTAWLFEVLGTVRRGPTANVVKVRQVL